MILMFAAYVRSACVNRPSADAVLNAFQKAAAPVVDARSMTAAYAYKGQGLEGTVSSTIDFDDGRYIEDTHAGPNKDTEGFDGRRAWMRDISGVTSPQEGGDKPLLARNAAYRNANLWWTPGRGGAAIEVVGCERLRITPRGGKPFDATFDPVTHMLKSFREQQSFGLHTSTEYSAYEKHKGHLIPTRISVVTNDDPASRETLTLSSVHFGNSPLDTAFSMPTSVAKNWTLPSSGRVTVPIRLINNHVVTDVRINGQGPFPFIVDTGGHDIVTPATVKKLGLVSKGNSPSFGAGDKAGSNGYAHVATLDAGGAVLHNQTVITLDFSPWEVEGVHLGGMLGVEFIERFVVRINYGAKTMTLIDPRRFGGAERQASGTAVPFVFYDHMPQVSGLCDGRATRLDIDTGSRAEVTMTTPFVKRAELRKSYPDVVAITDGWGVGGPSHSYVVRMGSLTLGSVVVPNVIAGFSLAKVGAFADSGSDGNVGSGLLKRFAVTFDYSRKTLYLKRLANPDADTGRFDRVGMWVNLSTNGLRVADVAPGGPAAEAGLKVGDTISGMDSRTVAGRELSDIRRDLKLVAAGKPFRIGFVREGRARTAVVIPRNLIPDVSTFVPTP